MEARDGNGETSLSDSFIATAAAGGQYMVEDDPLGGDDEKSDEPLREQDRFLPIANVARIMKKSIPKTGKIAKEAKECVQECVSEFISFITSEASERCQQEKRKTINGEDILFAMSTLGFDNYVEPLKTYLQRYRESNKGDKTMSMAAEGGLEEMAEDVFPATLQGGILTAADQTGQPNIIYTTQYQQNLNQPINFG